MWGRLSSRMAPSAGAFAAASAYAWRRPASFCEDGAQREGRVFPEFNAAGFAHNTQEGFSLFLQERCQRIFFIRHAEGFHNVAERESTFEPHNLVLLKENSGYVYWDAKLTPKGKEQCAQLKASIRGTSVWGFDKPLNLDLVVVSPMTRTLETAIISLGSPNSPGAPPFIANEYCRERISGSMCDGRRSVKELERDFPGVDFSLIEHDQDWMFHNTKETDEMCQERAVKFLQWLCSRPETRIAVVSHSLFLKNLLRQFADNVSEEDREAIHAFPANAEMRSVMLCAHRQFDAPEMTSQNKAAERKKRSVWKIEAEESPTVTIKSRVTPSAKVQPAQK